MEYISVNPKKHYRASEPETTSPTPTEQEASRHHEIIDDTAEEVLEHIDAAIAVVQFTNRAA